MGYGSPGSRNKPLSLDLFALCEGVEARGRYFSSSIPLMILLTRP
jgi:hypothetical protein